MGDGAGLYSNPQEVVFSLDEAADHLDVSGGALHRLSARFSRYLSARASDDIPSFTSADIVALVAVQKLIAQGYSDDEIREHLTPLRSNNHSGKPNAALASPFEKEEPDPEPVPGVEEILKTIISNQQAILNSQATLREMVNVVVQDNFSLKDENRKLRDRMLEIERVIAEYQRREETRKERIEHRLRALEGTVGALQQQLAQLVQIYRNQSKRGGWFS
jgi:flagellar capping protein FliD